MICGNRPDEKDRDRRKEHCGLDETEKNNALGILLRHSEGMSSTHDRKAIKCYLRRVCGKINEGKRT